MDIPSLIILPRPRERADLLRTQLKTTHLTFPILPRSPLIHPLLSAILFTLNIRALTPSRRERTLRVDTRGRQKDTAAQFLEEWGDVFDEWGQDGETSGDDANVAFDVEPDAQIDKGVSCIGPVDSVDEEDADDGCYADACCWKGVELAGVCALWGYDGMKSEHDWVKV